ncbi:hypothetical protein HZC53_05775 [Candidatus Uhrbacteria bacterium]|nr:hypothetical protein [Candidatus Uhrbacteria bacterium]
MAFKYDQNPFTLTDKPAPEVSRTHKKTPERTREASPSRPDLEHIANLYDLQAHLQSVRAKLKNKPAEQRLIADACDNVMGCDPWKYEPYLLDELFRERRNNTDPETVPRLRGLIRAGSWTSYPRPSQKDILHDLADVRRAEAQDWDWRLRNADPATAKEIREDRDEQAAEFTALEHAVGSGVIGEALEVHARTIENLLGHNWFALKKIMAANGLDWRQAETDPATSRLFHEIQKLRPLRDYIYFRLLYPKWAKFTKEK